MMLYSSKLPIRLRPPPLPQILNKQNNRNEYINKNSTHPRSRWGNFYPICFHYHRLFLSLYENLYSVSRSRLVAELIDSRRRKSSTPACSHSFMVLPAQIHLKWMEKHFSSAGNLLLNARSMHWILLFIRTNCSLFDLYYDDNCSTPSPSPPNQPNEEVKVDDL